MSEPSTNGVAAGGTSPARATLVMVALIIGASVANLDLAAANGALPGIGKAFGASQTRLSYGVTVIVNWLDCARIGVLASQG
jgi:hypothetical protein